MGEIYSQIMKTLNIGKSKFTKLIYYSIITTTGWPAIFIFTSLLSDEMCYCETASLLHITSKNDALRYDKLCWISCVNILCFF